MADVETQLEVKNKSSESRKKQKVVMKRGNKSGRAKHERNKQGTKVHTLSCISGR